jgi:hypothetical protein
LHDVIFWFEACAQRCGKIPELFKTSQQAFSACWTRVKMRSFRRHQVGGGFY